MPDIGYIRDGKSRIVITSYSIHYTKLYEIGISSCLLGEPVRYDGGHKLDRYLRDTLGNYVHYVPVCPEVECGLPVPREAMHLEGTPESPRLVTSRTGKDSYNFV